MHHLRILLLVSCFCLGIVSNTVSLHAEQGYRVHVNTMHVHNDRIRVMLFPPKVREDTAVLVFPATIPGTYETQNWWRLIRNITAVDTAGKYVPVRRTSDSMFIIDRANTIKAIGYEVDDTFDDNDTTADLFAPGGSTFEDSTVFLINHANVVGYYVGYQSLPYHVEVQHRKDLFGASGLSLARISDTLDVYNGETYDILVDNPVMYTVPDTASFVVGGTRVLVSIAHSGNGKLAKVYAKSLDTVCTGISKFLPRMPVERYAFLIYLVNSENTNIKKKPQMFGALEHGHSSFYVMPYLATAGSLPQIAAHEFLHILLPLTLHSEEIEAFDFRKPKMSQHLWLYEGVTEYFSYLSLLRNKGLTETEFRREFERKTSGVRILPEKFSFMQWSHDVLTAEGQRLYPMIYSYGAVNAMLLDITIRESTGNEKNLLSVINALSQRFGHTYPFKDDELIKILTESTNAQTGEYLTKYIQGTERIPMSATFAKIGWIYKDVDTVKGYGYGFEMKPGAQLPTLKPLAHNVLGIQDGDVLVKIGKKTIEESEMEDWQSMMEPDPGKPLSITVQRGDSTVVLTGKAEMMEREKHHSLKVDDKATPDQLALRQAVLFGKN